MPDVETLQVRAPAVGDGALLWQLARETGLDLNSPYAYLLLCRDFAETSAVASFDGDLAGFVVGYRRPLVPDVLFVWQVAVSPMARRRGVALAMLTHLRDRLLPAGVRYVEASVTPSNLASARLFGALSTVSETRIEQQELFAAGHFPPDATHEPEHLLRIGPFPGVSSVQ